MTRVLAPARTIALIVLAGALVARPPRPAGAQQTAATPAARAAAIHPAIAAIAAQLGVELQSSGGGEMQLGDSYTGLLSEPAKLARFGIRGMRAGARVTMSRVAPDRVRVEADQVDAPTQGGATLRLDAAGALVPPA